MQQIPVYSFTGFLDSGKTKFIQETLEDPRFNAGERTLLLVFEEGEEEYDFSTYPHQNVHLAILDQQTVTTKQLQDLAKTGISEEDADQIVFLYRDRYYSYDGAEGAELLIAKSPRGQTGTVHLDWDWLIRAFKNI